MDALSLSFFFICTYALGFTATSFVKNAENFLERQLMRVGVGLALLPLLALLLNLVKIPADWRLLLLISLAYPLYYLAKHRQVPSVTFKLTKYNIAILLMLLLFVFNAYIYISGAFVYPYLENDDSWSHSIGVKYYAEVKNAFDPTTQHTSYLNPYPPAYDVLLGIIHQTTESVHTTLKFYNALIIALSTIFFFFFARQFTNNSTKALIATFALVSIPSFLSHFIWALSLAMPLYFVSFYCAERIRVDNKWWIVTGLCAATTLICTPTHSTFFGLLLGMYIGLKILLERKLLWNYLFAGGLGLGLAMALWWIPMIVRYGFIGTLQNIGIVSKTGLTFIAGAGSGDRIYTLANFFVAQKQNMINNPIGIGVMLSVLGIVALVAILLMHWSSIRKHIKLIVPITVVSMSILLLFLWKTFTGKVFGDSEGPVSFMAYFSSQFFVAGFMMFFLFVFLCLFILNYKENLSKKHYLIITLAWLVLLFYAVNAAPYTFKISAFRAWMIMAIPVCLLAAEGAFILLSIAKAIAGRPAYLILALVIVSGVYMTSTQQKMAVNTANWPPGAFWTSGEEIGSYIWMKQNLPVNSRMFTYSNSGAVIGMDMYICHWCDHVQEYKDNGFSDSAEETHRWLRSNSYEYLVIDGQAVRTFGANASNNKIQSLGASGLFTPVFQNQGAIVFRIN